VFFTINAVIGLPVIGKQLPEIEKISKQNIIFFIFDGCFVIITANGKSIGEVRENEEL